MQESDLRPAQAFALNFGVKAVVYGKPGMGKTPICVTTAPRPVVLMTEPGFLSMRKSTAPTFPAFTPAKVEEFMTWITTSAEARNYDTLVVDSATQMAEQNLADHLGVPTKGGNEAHGMRAYGLMARQIMEILSKLYFMPAKHIILITKLQNFENNGANYRRPSFPGKDLAVRVPHLFDLVMEIGDFNVPGFATPQRAFCTKEKFDSMGRDRSGMLGEFEPPNIGEIIKKAMT